jgi:hypothetical protein
MKVSWNRVFRAAFIVFCGWALSFLLLAWNYYQQPAAALRPTDIELHTRAIRPGADLIVAGVLILVVLARVFARSQRFSPVSEVIGCGIALGAALGTFYYSLGLPSWLPRPGEGLNWFLENVLAYLGVVSLSLAALWLATRRQEPREPGSLL